MKRHAWLVLAAVAILGTAGHAADDASPLFGVTIPAGYRQWEVIAVTNVRDELKSIVGNPLAVTAHQAVTLPFPDGTVLTKLTWQRVPLAGFDDVFVPGAPVRLEIMVKDAQKYAATGGWGFGRFVDGKPVDEAQHKTCFGCHAEHARAHDFVFTHFAP